MQDSQYMRGDLVSLSSRRRGTEDSVVLGSMDDYANVSDPCVPPGTVCMVQRRLEDEGISSEEAYVVMLEMNGTLQNFWVYKSEMALVARP